ncbi:hypothetical protein B6U81_01755 [Thermoplasmatales archaeon ex4484_30]|nr:MAG: hypothetical protein B6U81_01755 [Thermoplasmatales archaeon ex4484_30]
MKWNGKRGMGCIGGVVAVLAAIMLMTQAGEAATSPSISVSIAGLGSDGVLAKNYALFNISIANATNISKVQLWGGTNSSNLSKLKEWTQAASSYTYNWTNLTDGEYYYKVAVLDNGTWHNVTGNFTVQISIIMPLIEKARQYWWLIAIFGFIILIALARRR